jgi:hypothetical protein
MKKWRKEYPGKTIGPSEKAYFIFLAAARYHFSRKNNYIGAVVRPLPQYPEIQVSLSHFENWTPAKRFRPRKQVSRSDANTLAREMSTLLSQICYLDENLQEYETDAHFICRLKDYNKKRREKENLYGRLYSLKTKARRWAERSEAK